MHTGSLCISSRRFLLVRCFTAHLLFSLSCNDREPGTGYGSLLSNILIFARDLDAVSILSEMFVIARGKRGKS